MMGTTHAAAGVVLAVPVALAAPELAVPAAMGALAGGIFPDVDLAVGVHRKTLHFPVYYWVGFVPAGVAAFVTPSAFTVAAALFFAAAAVHSVSDWFGAGEELKPWEATSEEAVYVHPLGRWLRPKRWVRYDGAPEDLLLVVVLSVPGLLVFDGLVQALLLVGLGISVVYAVVRKRLPPAVQRFVR